MSKIVFEHLSYLHQVSDLLQDKLKSQAARLGHIAKEVQLKYVVHIRGSDPPKLRRCKACQSPLGCDNIGVKGSFIEAKCPLCGLRKKFSSSRERETQRIVGKRRKKRRKARKRREKNIKKKIKEEPMDCDT